MKKTQLFLLHFAGGNCYSYSPLMGFLKEFNVISPELPGRGGRAREELLLDFKDAAEDIYRQIVRELTGARFMIYGHSMGAYLALRVAGMLERAGRAPAQVIVSGNAGPGMRDTRSIHSMNDDELLEEIKKLGGLSQEILGQQELLDFYLPIIRADFCIAEENGLEAEPPIAAPLCAMMGNKEEQVARIDNWGRYTASEFSSFILEGDHFFVLKNPQRVASIIRERHLGSTIANKYQ